MLLTQIFGKTNWARRRPTRDRRALAAAALLATAAMGACETEYVHDGPNFVFVLVDTLRADHVGVYGHDRDTTPFFDSLARQGLVFEQVVAQAPWTGASMASLWTSMYPSETGAGVTPDSSGVRWLAKSGETKIRPDAIPLAEILAASGYHTIAVISNVYAGTVFGLERGFEVHVQQGGSDAAAITGKAIETLDQYLSENEPAPFFLYVHYLDAHEPTFPPEPYRARFPSRDGEPHREEHAHWKFGDNADPQDPDFQSFREHKVDVYDASINYIDGQVARIAQLLDARGRRNSTIFIVASDHGQEFWDHVEFERDTHLDPRGLAGVAHGQSLFGELTDVPLILQGSGIPVGRIETRVRNLDIAPTILGLAGVESPDSRRRGVDLLEIARGDEGADLEAFSESLAYGPEAKSLEIDGYKLIRYSATRSGRNEFLFDRSNDPGEQIDILDSAPEAASSLRRALDAIFAGRELVQGEEITLDPETRSQLQAIGYLE